MYQPPQVQPSPEEMAMLQQEAQDQPGVMDILLMKMEEVLNDQNLNKDVMANTALTLANAYNIIFQTEMKQAEFQLQVHQTNIDAQMRMGETTLKANQQQSKPKG